MYLLQKAEPTPFVASRPLRKEQHDYLESFLYLIRCGMIEPVRNRRGLSLS